MESFGKSGLLFNTEGNWEVRLRPNQLGDPTLPRKASFCESRKRPYRNPTQVDEDKNPKALEITVVKELGNLAP